MEAQSNRRSESEKSTETDSFEAIFPELRKDMTEMFRPHPEISKATKWFEQVNLYNVPNGRKRSPRSLMILYDHLVGQTKCPEEDLRKVRIMAWCVQWVVSYVKVADDIMDESITRNGQTCWHKKEGVGLIAINDSAYLESAAYALLQKHFRTEPYYLHVMELFHKVKLDMVMGWSLEFVSAAREGNIDVSEYTMEVYTAIPKWKAGPLACFSVRLAAYMTGITDDQAHLRIETICLQFGIYGQVENDYEDCYADPTMTGKIGTDIEEGVCTWLIVTALEKGNEKQIQILHENYGYHDSEKVSRVKDVYNQLDMPGLFKDYKKRSHWEMSALIDKHRGVLPAKMFLDYAMMLCPSFC